MKKLKFIVGLTAGIIVFGGIVKGLNYIYVPGSDYTWERILWHNFYEDQGKIDNLFLGSSHVFCDINPFILDEYSGEYNFNLSSSAQLMNGTYYLLKEADKNNELSHVYIELYYHYNVKETWNEDADPVKTQHRYNFRNVDYMKPSFNKLNYMLGITDIENYPSVWLKFTRYRSDIFDWNRTNNIITAKEEGDFKDFSYYESDKDDSGEWETEYKEKGYYYTTRTYEANERFVKQDVVLQENPLAESSEDYLRKTLSYCQKRNIPVTLFVSPMYELKLISTENYDNYISQIRGIAEEYQVEYYDFNLVDEKYLPIQRPEYFMDGRHLNATGAEIFTKFFFNTVFEGTFEKQECFYDSYEQKLQKQDPEVYGIYYKEAKEDEVEGRLFRNMKIASNRKTGMEYKITCLINNDEEYVVQDFSENNEFVIDQNEHGLCVITYRLKSEPDLIQTMEIKY